ncbi:MAG TPA: hypothetical protein VKP00_04720, partial [Gemmatimonadaceae bacterium]|nr:hypothetical protein [Gemmatimonadaceae bacterium]
MTKLYRTSKIARAFVTKGPSDGLIPVHATTSRAHVISSIDASVSPTSLFGGVSVRCRTLASVVAAIALGPIALLAQGREITGKVTQVGTGTPITEATIGILG